MKIKKAAKLSISKEKFIPKIKILKFAVSFIKTPADKVIKTTQARIIDKRDIFLKIGFFIFTNIKGNIIDKDKSTTAHGNKKEFAILNKI